MVKNLQIILIISLIKTDNLCLVFGIASFHKYKKIPFLLYVISKPKAA